MPEKCDGPLENRGDSRFFDFHNGWFRKKTSELMANARNPRRQESVVSGQ